MQQIKQQSNENQMKQRKKMYELSGSNCTQDDLVYLSRSKIDIMLIRESREGYDDSEFGDFTINLKLENYFHFQYFFSVELDLTSPKSVCFLIQETDGMFKTAQYFRLIDVCRMMTVLEKNDCILGPFFSIKEKKFIVSIDDSIQKFDLNQFNPKSIDQFKKHWTKMCEWIIKCHSVQ